MSRRDRALRSIETRVRSAVRSVLARLAAAIKAIYEAVRELIRALTGAEAVSNHRFYTALTDALDSARASIEATLRAGWRTAAGLGAAATGPGPRVDDGYLRRVVDDLARIFTDLRQSLLERIRAAHDEHHGDHEAQRRAVGLAVEHTTAQARTRTDAAAVVVVHRGYTAGQSAAHEHQHGAQGGWRKIWQTTSQDPCPVCRALDGTAVEAAGVFDAHATLDTPGSAPPVFYDLTGPPRHPNCRCRLLYVPSAAQSAPPRAAGSLPVRVRASEIRTMSAARFQNLLAAIQTLGRRFARRIGRTP